MKDVESGPAESTLPPKKKRAFFLPSNTFRAIKFTELEQCCCADVPCLSIIKEYCESSSLHGLKYISEDGRHWTERVLWFILCLMGFVLTIYFIIPIWIKWNSHPTLTTLDSTNHPVWEIDFPAVTICSPNKVIRQKLETIARNSPSEWNVLLNEASFEELQELFEVVVNFKDPEMLETLTDLNDLSGNLSADQVAEALLQVMPNCTDFIKECQWQGSKEDCNEIFELRKTDDGFCCSFNALRQSEIVDLSALRSHNRRLSQESTFSKGIKSFQEEFFDNTNHEIVAMFDLLWSHKNPNPENEPNLTNPKTDVRRVNNANHHRGLTLLLNVSSSDYFITSDNFAGLKVLVHDPAAYPELQSKALAIDSNQEIFITTIASQTDASSRIRDFAVTARNCLFEDERNEPNSQVTMFKYYSEENCLLECRAKQLLERCGCLPYYYPRLDILLENYDVSLRVQSFTVRIMSYFQNNMTTCDWDGLQCLANASDLLDSIRPVGVATFGQGSSGAECACPPACSKTRYTTTSSTAKFPNKASR